MGDDCITDACMQDVQAIYEGQDISLTKTTSSRDSFTFLKYVMIRDYRNDEYDESVEDDAHMDDSSSSMTSISEQSSLVSAKEVTNYRIVCKLPLPMEGKDCKAKRTILGTMIRS